MPDRDVVEAAVREHYAAAAVAAGCCGEGGSVVDPAEAEMFGQARYGVSELEGVPAEAVAASFGCANPVLVADLAAGEVVLDLGSGGGIDVLLSARRVGPSGHVYGLDMTDEMLELARGNQARAGVGNVTFIRGQIEEIPLPDASVDVVISNCVINLSVDKAAVFAQTWRVLRPGGRLCVADVVADSGTVPAGAEDLRGWACCLAGALTRDRFRRSLEAAGFAGISIADSHTVADGYTSVLVKARRPKTGGG